MSGEPIDPAAIMAAHQRSAHVGGMSGQPFCENETHQDSTYWPCEAYRLAEGWQESRELTGAYRVRLHTLTAERDALQAKVGRVRTAVEHSRVEDAGIRADEPPAWKRGARHVRVAVLEALDDASDPR